MRKLDGKVALVTGGVRGLGRAYALRLAGLGANVAIADLRLKGSAKANPNPNLQIAELDAAELRTQGVDALELEVDVSDYAAVQHMIEQVVERWGRLDVLVCNAGGGAGKMTENKASEINVAQLDFVIKVNLLGTIYTCLAASPIMKRQRSGKIITVSSGAAVYPFDGGIYAHYGTAKGAIMTYTRYLAQDLGAYNITVNCLTPGFMETERVIVGIKDIGLEKSIASTALGRIGQVEDCAKALEFLATDLSDYVTGQVIAVDGGYLRGPS
jgi:3-oxoacyl-[acyl-carrier protein] reductase